MMLIALHLAVLNLDSEFVDVDRIAVHLRPVFQKDLVCTRRYGSKQEAVAAGLGESTILRSKRNLSINARCAKVAVDNWVSQVRKVLHEGVIYRHIILNTKGSGWPAGPGGMPCVRQRTGTL
jgi:hypothetical protein